MERSEAGDQAPAGDVLVASCLGHNYECVCDVSREFRRCGVVIRAVINKFHIDGVGEKAARDAPIAFISATTQAQAKATTAAKAGRNQACQANDRRRTSTEAEDSLSEQRRPAAIFTPDRQSLAQHQRNCAKLLRVRRYGEAW